MTDTSRFLREHATLSRRYFLQAGAGAAATLGLWCRPGGGAEPAADVANASPELADAIARLESYLTAPERFQDVSRGKPLPHSLSDEKKHEVGLTRESWRLEVIADPEQPTTVRKPLTKADGTAITFDALVQLAEQRAVRFAKVMTCLNIGCPLGMGIWEGVPLRDIVWMAKPGDNVRRVFYYGYHNDDPRQIFQSSLPIGRVFEDPFDLPPVILCYKLNGQWLTSERGGPVRLVVPEAYGYKCIKWLSHVVLTSLAHANDTYAKENNDIDSPLKSFAATLSVSRKVKAGEPIPVTGYAQVGIGGLSKVQVWIAPSSEEWPGRRSLLRHGAMARRGDAFAAGGLGRGTARGQDSSWHDRLRRPDRPALRMADAVGESTLGRAYAAAAGGRLHAALAGSRRKRKRPAHAASVPQVRPRGHRTDCHRGALVRAVWPLAKVAPVVDRSESSGRKRGSGSRRASAGRSFPPPASRGEIAGKRPSPRISAADLLACALLIGTVCIVYGGALEAPFVFDDANSVLFNPSITRLWPLWGLAGSEGPLNPPEGVCTAGRPLVNLSLAVNYHVGHFDPQGYHLSNLVVHTGSVLLLWAIVRRTLRLERFAGRFDRAADLLAFSVALAWAVHPLATEAVEYVTQRSELLVGFFYLATLYASLRYWAARLPKRQAAWLIAATLTCYAGMASKEVMVSAPIMVLLFDRAFVAGSLRRALRDSWPLYVSLASAWIVLSALNASGPRSDSAGFHLGLPAHVWWFTQAKVLAMYVTLAFWPWPLVIHYEVPTIDTFAAAWPWLLPLAIFGIVTAVLLWRNTVLGFLATCALMVLAPTFVVPIITEVAGERRMYLPLAAIVISVIVGGYALAERAAFARGRRGAQGYWPLAVTVAAALSASALFAALSVHRLAAYRDAVTLWQDTVLRQSRSALAHTNFGLALLSVGRTADAIGQYQTALELEPQHSAIHRNNLGYALMVGGRTDEAIAQFEEVLRIDPDSVEAHNNLGTMFLNSGRPREAITQFEDALRLKPDYAEGHAGLGIALAAAGRAKEASRELEQALKLKSDYLDAAMHLARAYADLERPVDAIRAAQNAVDLARAQGKVEQARTIEAWLSTLRTGSPGPLAPAPR
jgi:DMSO/TMAO reductase YedYZ molybdopterin-dependent catalytic subunit/Flp pilus assembly protein TadD